MNIVGISGSLRDGSLNTKLLHLVKEIAGPGHGLEVVSIADIPLYNADVQEAGFPAPVQALADRAAAADALYIVSPEYNYGMSGVLKNTIDWLSRTKPMPFAGKPVALAGASPGKLGTAYAHADLRHVLSMLGARVAPPPNVLVSAAHEALDAPGDQLRELIGKQIAALESLAA